VIVMPVKLINLTPHPVVIKLPNNEEVIIPSSGVARVRERTSEVGVLEAEVDGKIIEIPVKIKELDGSVEGLPQPQDGVIYIVSYLAAQVAWKEGRRDVFATGDPVRDEQGRVIGISSLYANPQ
jgi:hypothetical protein